VKYFIFPATISLILSYLSFPNLNLHVGVLAWICFFPIFVYLARPGFWIRRLIVVYLFFVCFFLALFWLNPFQYAVRFHGAENVLAFLSFFIVFPACYTLLFLFWKHLKSDYSPLVAAAIFASTWVGFEYLLTIGKFGFPLSFAITQFDQPQFIQLAQVTGIYGISFLLVFVNAVAAEVWLGEKYVKIKYLCLTIGIPIIVFLFGQSYMFWQGETSKHGKALPLLLIQPNISYRDAFHAAPGNSFQAHILRDLINLSKAGVSENNNMTLVWPELSISELSIQNPLTRIMLMDLMAKQAGMILGVRLGAKNAILSIDRNLNILGKYEKVKLVPGFETNIYQQSSNSRPIPISTTRGTLGPFICFEVLFPQAGRKITRQGAGALGCLSFNSWLGRNNWGLLHAAYAPFRAVENRRYTFFLNNSGPSITVSPLGVIGARLPEFKPGFIRALAVTDSTQTFYTRFGDLFAWLCIIFSTPVVLIFFGKKMRRLGQYFGFEREEKNGGNR